MSQSTLSSRLIPPYSLLNADQTNAGILLLCDHASALIPPDLGDLGLSAVQRRAHIAWDIGAAKVTRTMARRLNCPALFAGVSRLVVDCNRFPHDPSAMPALTCGCAVPGNGQITPEQRQERLDSWFHPYHQAIDGVLKAMPCPLLVSIHSFTPQIDGQLPRPWHVGILWNQDRRLSDLMVDALRQDPQLVVGENQPYSGQDINYTLDRHAGSSGHAHLSVEIRQDLLADEYGCVQWGERLARILAPLTDLPQLRQPLSPALRLVLD